MTLARLVTAIALLVCAVPAPAAGDKAIKGELEAKAHAFADAIAPGDKAAWGAAVTGLGDLREGQDIKWRRLS